MQKQNLDYFRENDSEKFTFYRLPKQLFTDAEFSAVSPEAKLLYGFLLDRMSLSMKNGWVDGENRVYIYFTLDEVSEMLGIGKEKAIKLFAELDDKNGCGLIRRKRRGQGKPAIIYVMNFVSHDGGENSAGEKTDEKADEKTEKPCAAQTCENPTPSLAQNRLQDFGESEPQEVGKTECNYNKLNYNNINNTDFSDINPISSHREQPRETESDLIDEIDKYRDIISQNIDYEWLKDSYGADMADGVLELMVEVICSRRPTIVISGGELPTAAVRARFLKLNCSHIEYVIERLKSCGNRVRNIKGYVLTMLYNSYTTIGYYYTAEVAADGLGGRNA